MTIKILEILLAVKFITELQLSKSNDSDVEAPFLLDLHVLFLVLFLLKFMTNVKTSTLI